MNITIVADGSGGNLFYIIKYFKLRRISLELIKVISPMRSKVSQIANESGIIHFEYSKYSENNDKEMIRLLQLCQPDIVLLFFGKILSYKICNIYKGKIFNIHYSQLPHYKGKVEFEKMFTENIFIGVTCHEVVYEVDSGPIYSQAVFRRIGYSTTLEKQFKIGVIIIINFILDKLGIDISNIINIGLPDTLFSNKLNYIIELNDDFWDKDL